MVKFDKTFRKVMEHTQKLLKTSHRDLERRIQSSILSSQSKPSPMLKYYNELLQNTNFMLPERHRLEVDQLVFRKMIEKICNAHRLELAWVKNMMVHDAKSLLTEKFEYTSS